MSQPEPSSQDSTETQEIYSQGSFQEIWESLGRTFSNPEKIIQGVLTDPIPLTVQHTDVPELDNLEFSYEQRIFKSLEPSSPGTYSHQLSDLLQPSFVNGTTAVNKLYTPVSLPLILPNTNFPGVHKFSVEFEPNTAPITKATPWVYVADREKLFVKMQCVCPILFKITGTPPPGTGVRGILMYKRPEHYKDIVTRCPNHKNTSKDDHPNQEHVMRCENPSTIYDTCPKTERLSLFIPLSDTNPVEGEGYFKELFKFTCFNSCVGGMNRRPTFLLFRLECGGASYGRAVVEIRICASPGRDSTEKEVSTNQKNGKNTEKPTSTTDAITPMPASSTHSPGSSPTTLFPPRPSVLMSASKDPTTAPEPFQFPSVQAQQSKKRKDYVVAKDGYVYKKIKKTCPADSTEDEMFTITIRGRERYEMLLKINEGLHLLDGIKPPEQLPFNRYANNGIDSTQEYTKIQPKTQPLEIKKEKADSSQYDISPQSSQEQELSQLSRTTSDASSQSSTTQNAPEYSATVFTMKRTISLKKSAVPKGVLSPK